MSIYRDFSPKGWQPIVLSIRRGDFVEKERFIEPLRGDQPIPKEVREYLAGMLNGSIKRGRGQPSKSARKLSDIDQLKNVITRETGFSWEVYCALKYAFSLYERCKRRHIKCSREIAVERSANRHKMKRESLYGQYKRAKQSNFIQE